MKILYIVPYTPDPVRVRPYNLVRALNARGNAVTLATLVSGDRDLESLSRLEREGIRVFSQRLTKVQSLENCVRALPTNVPFQAAYCEQHELARQLQQLVADGFDAVHVEHLRGAWYGLQVAAKTPVVWDSVDCISSLFEQAARTSASRFGKLASRLELPRTRRYEPWLVRQFARTLVTSEQDRAAFLDLFRRLGWNTNGPDAAKITVLPNGVDLDYFAPQPVEREPATIVLSGKMSYHANVTAALFLVRQVMPAVWAQVPDARVQIVGQNPPAEIRGLADANPGRVIVTGYVPDLRPYLARATAAAAPIVYGAGIQNKVLEAMAMGTPVVATGKAVGALSARAEQEVLVADTAEAFAKQIVRLLRDRSLCTQLGSNGRQYVQRNHDWKRISEDLEKIYYLANQVDPVHR